MRVFPILALFVLCGSVAAGPAQDENFRPAIFYANAAGSPLDYESSGMFQVHLPVLQIGSSQMYGFRLARPHKIQAFQVWIGTSYGSTLEVGTAVTICRPKKDPIFLAREFDKHADDSGTAVDEWRTFPLPIALPVGTELVAERGPGHCFSGDCSTEIEFRFYDAD